jgi:bidirectional [NiFe] hydrogenase diaphorase subunit
MSIGASATPVGRKAAPPTDDKRWRIVDAAMRRQGYQPSGAIEALHAEQEAFGFLDDAGMRYVAASLGLPPSRVFGVATFYNFFHLKPQGRHTCVVCTGTACYIKGGTALLQAIEHTYGIEMGQTTPDGALSLLTARCLGSCGLAPVAVLDGEVSGPFDAPRLLAGLAALVGHDA